jgi:hypothetical protein
MIELFGVMKKTYLCRLGSEIQALVEDIERRSGIEICVETDDSRVGRNVGEPDPLACVIDESEARLLVPSSTELSDGPVLHELLHIHRFLVEGVPQISVCEDRWTPHLEQVFAQLDNNLEHLVIVPLEIQRIPERHGLWVKKFRRVLSQVRDGKLPKADQKFLAIYGRFFVDYVLKDTTLLELSESILDTLGLQSEAEVFRQKIFSALSSKEAAIRVVVDLFKLDPSLICLDYLNPRRRSCEQKSLH